MNDFSDTITERYRKKSEFTGSKTIPYLFYWGSPSNWLTESSSEVRFSQKILKGIRLPLYNVL